MPMIRIITERRDPVLSCAYRPCKGEQAFPGAYVPCRIRRRQMQQFSSGGTYLTYPDKRASQCPARGDLHPHSVLNAAVKSGVPPEARYMVVFIIFCSRRKVYNKMMDSVA